MYTNKLSFELDCSRLSQLTTRKQKNHNLKIKYCKLKNKPMKSKNPLNLVYSLFKTEFFCRVRENIGSD